MDTRIQSYIDKIEQLSVVENIEIPPSFQKMKNQLASKDYAMAETLRTNKGEIDRFYDFHISEEINNLLDELKKLVIELKLEKEKAKLSNLT